MTKGAKNVATMHSLRVDPELRQAAEGVLYENESPSTFMEAALRDGIARRRLQREFVFRALESLHPARCDNAYFDAVEVHAELEGMLNAATQVR
jgi:hypothetical protein